MKASNIYQKLKSAGIGNPDGVPSQKPAIKGLGSPAKLVMPTKKIMEAAKTKKQQNKNAEARKAGKAVSYKDAYADADKKKYKTYEEFEKAAKAYNRKKYNTENPTSEAKKQNISKKQLADNVTAANQKKLNESKNKNASKTEDPNASGATPPKNKVDVAKEKVDTANKNVKDAKKSVKEDRKAKKLADKAARKQKRADRIKKEGGTRVGNFLRGIGKKKDKSPAEMKKSPAKMKKSPAKMGKKSPTKFNAKLKKAAAEGKIKGKFKEVVENAPIKLKDKDYKPGKKVKTGGSVSSRRAEKLIAKGKGRMVYKIGGIGKDNQPGGKNNKGQLMKNKRRSVKIKNIK